MAYSVAGRIRIRVVNTITADVIAAYAEGSIDADPQLDDVTVNNVAGTRMQPTRYKVTWKLSFPYQTTNLASIQLALRSGNVISFEYCPNPAAAVTDQIFEVVDQTTVGKRGMPLKVDKNTRWEVEGEGGDFYPEQVGRLGLPAPFNGA